MTSYGAWPSPVSAEDAARAGAFVSAARYGDGAIWWSETRPDEGGRTAVCRGDTEGARNDVIAAPWNARTRVHEYGGGAWTVAGGTLVFAEFGDQRLYRVVPGGEPEPITPAPPRPAALRYADLTPARDGAHVLCVRESHDESGDLSRDIVAVPLDGSAADDPGAVRSLVAGSRFLAHPRESPDGARLAWIAWDHPQMPWDGTTLRVAEGSIDAGYRPARTLLGSVTESVLQPTWLDNRTLLVASDRSGWWRLYRVDVGDSADGAVTPVYEPDADVGGPLWTLGARWFAELPGHRVLAVRTLGRERVAVVDLATGAARDLDLAGLETVSLADVDGSRALLVCGGSTVPSGLRELDVETGAVRDVRVPVEGLPDPSYLSVASDRVFKGPGGRDVHAIVYPPHNPDVSADAGELPPYLVVVHGGPTGRSSARASASIAYWTTRGIGVADVNYGGSSGYGRAYRERLRGQWGIVDVEDVVAVVEGLAASGDADPRRVAIQGGSAGGWTVLAALTTTDTFACGISYFGVADAALLAEHTHDFESRYLDGLIGPLPEAQAVYDERSPLNSVDGLSCPVLLLQGLDDPVVPPAQAERFRDALAAKGIPHRYIAFEGESHGFRKAATVVTSLEATLSFLGQVMGFDPPGVPRLELDRP
jgi:dipeptidyl aminopeptidase/acylaminoacyl peptidase